MKQDKTAVVHARRVVAVVWSLLFLHGWFVAGLAEERWPALPDRDEDVLIPAQEWPREPGPRTVKVYIRYPGGGLTGVNPQTGLMLTLHCWGHSGWTASADPVELAERYNVVAIAVDYLQSGDYDPAANPLPYDYGYFQALDALRALYLVWHGLEKEGVPFDKRRIYATGGSGGGNVALMCNKLAPRTFACIVDMCGMAKLNDDIAFGRPGGSRANACYSQDPECPRYLAPDAQTIRFVGYPPHLAAMKQSGNQAKVIVIHGADDDLIPCEDSREMVENMDQAGLDVQPHFVTKADVDGRAVQSAGHILGDWTAIVFRYGDTHLKPDSPAVRRRTGPTDFEARRDVCYRTQTGAYIISYTDGFPEGRYEPNP